MHVVLSIVVALVLVGHAVAIWRFKSYWPFDHYPMYSTPVARMRYPIVRGKQLDLFALLEVHDDGTTSDLLSTANIYPEAFHPLDRVEVVLTLVKAGMLKVVDESRATPKLEQALTDLLAFARTNRPELRKLRLVAMEWSDFRNPSSDFKHPDRTRVIAEVSHS